MTGFLSLMFWTIFARLFIVKIGFDTFGSSIWMELEAYIIQLCYSIMSLFVLLFIALFLGLFF